jgi:hypothetical protein
MRLNVNPKCWAAGGAVLAGALVLPVLLATAPGAGASAGGHHPTTTSTTAATTTTTTAPPLPLQLVTSNFACSSGVCEIGPGNVGMSFAAGMYGAGGLTCPSGSGCNGNNFRMSVVSGSLPPGLQLDEQFNVNYWTIWGTPTRAGTYAFTMQVTPWNNNEGGVVGPSVTQQLTITVGTGSSDRAVIRGAGWNGHTGTLSISGYDVNISALWSVSVTSTGRVLISSQPKLTTYPIDGTVIVRNGTGYPCPFGGCDLTVTNSLGSSTTVHLGPPTY